MSSSGTRAGVSLPYLVLTWLALFLTSDAGRAQLPRFVRLDRSQGLSNNTVEAVVEDRRGFMWFGTSDGLNRYDGYAFVVYRNVPGDPGSLIHNFVWALYEDRAGSLWVGTLGGLNRYERDTDSFTRFAMGEPGSGHDSVFALHETRDGELWIGTSRGLVSMDRAAGTFVRYLPSAREPERGPSGRNVMGVCEDPDGSLWVGTDAGLDRLDRTTGTFEHFVHDEADPASLSDSSVLDVFVDRRGGLWVTTERGNDPDDESSLASNTVWSLYEDADGVLWVATGEGLSAYDRERDSFRSYRHDPRDAASLSNDQILAILEDREGAMWLGTEGGGLNRLDRETGTFVAFRGAEGLPNDTVMGILEDDRGFLWLSTNDGLSRFDPRTRSFTNYQKSDGLLAGPFNKGAYLKSRAGELFFGGANGFNSFDPSRVKENDFVPPVVLTDFQIFNRPVAIGGPESPLARHITEAERIRLRHDQSVFTLAFAALSYRAPEKNGYAYKLEGFDRDWSYVGSKRTVTYTNLDPGTYVFRVKGSNNSGLWNERATSIEIVVAPPFWATWWFRAAAAGAAAALLAAVYLARTRAIRARNRALEEEVAARVRAHLELLEKHRSQAKEVKVLRGLLPICSGCKRIRDDQGHWLQMERYIDERSDATFSHGLCPDCIETLYPELNIDS